MLTTTRSAAARARRTKLRCPRWIAPIVGTNATRRPCRRHRLTTRRTVGIAAVTITAGSPPRSIRFLLGGESAGPHVRDVAPQRPPGGLRQARGTAGGPWGGWPGQTPHRGGPHPPPPPRPP